MANAREVGTAYLKILPTMKGMKSKLFEGLNREGAGAGEQAGNVTGQSLMGKLKNTIVKLGTTLAIGKTITDSLMSGADLEQQIGGIETLFKDSAGKMRQYADQAYQTAGMSASHYMETATSFSATLLQGLGGDTAKAAEYANTAIVQMSDNANKMGTDISMIQNAYQGFAKQNYTMLDNLKLGYGGTQSEMARLINDSGVLGDTVKVTAETVKDVPFNTVIDAIGKIQSNLGITGTTAKEAASTFSGSFTSMKASVQNLLASLMMNGKDGVDVTQAMSGLITSVSTFVFDNLIPAISRMVMAIPPALTTLVATIDWGGVINTAITAITTFLTTTLPTWVNQGAQFLQWIIDGLTSRLPDLITTWTTLQTSVINFISQNLPRFLQKGAEMVSTMVTGIVNNLPSVINSFFQLVTGGLNILLQNMPQFLSKGGEIVINLMHGLINNIPSIVGAIAQGIASLLSTIAQNLPQFVQKGIELLGKLGAGLIQAIPELVGKIPQIFNNIRSAFSNFDWIGIGRNIIQGIGSGISNAVTGLVDSAIKACGKLVDSVKSFFGIKSPSRLMRDQVGTFLPAGVAVGIDQNTKTAVKSARKMNEAVMSETNKLMLDTSSSIQANVKVGVGNSMSGTGGMWGNAYTINQTINSHDSLSPSEMEMETARMIRRLEW